VQSREGSGSSVPTAVTDVGVALLRGLEKNWEGDARSNPHVLTTLAAAVALDTAPSNETNWRLQAHLMRAYYDAYVQARYVAELAVEADVRRALTAAVASADVRPVEAERLLAEIWLPTNATIVGWRHRAFALARALDVTLGTGSIYGGMAILQSQDPTLGLGTIDTPLSNHLHLRAAVHTAAALPTPAARRATLTAVLNRTDPGPGGYYDQLGAVPRSGRLCVGFGPAADPQFLYAPLVAYDEGLAEEAVIDGDASPVCWFSYAQAYWNATVSLEYTNLDPAAQYRVKLVYVAQTALIQLHAVGADGKAAAVHGPTAPNVTGVYEYAVPTSATQGGSVTLVCSGPRGTGGFGRTCQIAEVWLVKSSAPSGKLS
jgi:hypothetical protein